MNEFLLSLDRFQQQSLAVLETIMSRLYQHSMLLSWLYIAGLIGGFFIYLLLMPIQFTDTDMWYHMAGGRFSWENSIINNSSFFSYLSPEREWVNYFWGFQLLVYSVFEMTGYQGLIVFKAILVTLVASLVAAIILHGQKQSRIRMLQLAVLALIIFLLSHRMSGVRPHLVSYFFISLFIYILYCRPRYLYILPFMTILWVNLHGVEWVVGALLVGAYIIQTWLDYKRRPDEVSLRPLMWLFACIPAMFLNPDGVSILFAPFSLTSEAYYFITELQPAPLHLKRLFTEHQMISEEGALVLLFGFAWLGLMGLWLKGQLRFFPFILAVGGLILLSRGYRFVWEWFLLSLPLFALTLNRLFTEKHANPYSLLMSLGLCFIMLSPMVSWVGKISERYPLDEANLPVATTAFIKKNNISGKYLLPPVFVGYVEWHLYPDIKVHVDMQFPPFDEMDYLETVSARYSPGGFNAYVDKYKPQLISVLRTNTAFQYIVAQSNAFVPVMFDSKLVLYINKHDYPDIAQKNHIQQLDVFRPLSGLRSEHLDGPIKELKSILEYDEWNSDALILLSKYLVQNNDLSGADIYLDKLVERYGDYKDSYYLRAMVYQRLFQFEFSIEYFKKALEVNNKNTPLRHQILKHMASSYFQLKNYERAYQAYREGMNIYAQIEPLEKYYEYAFSAFMVDDIEQAQRLCALILQLGYQTDQLSVMNARGLLKVIEKGQYKRAFWK